MGLFDDLGKRWARLWASLGNTNRSGDNLPTKGESLAPVPTLQEYLVSGDDSHGEDRKIFSPLLNGMIRGSVFAPSGVPVVSDEVTTGRTLLIAAGAYGQIVSIVETASAATVGAITNADAAADATNTLALSSSLNNTRQNNPFTGIIIRGPAYLARSSGTGTLRAVTQPWAQIDMTT